MRFCRIMLGKGELDGAPARKQTVELMTVLMLTQLMPSSTYQIRRELRVLGAACG
jgi:hypothetical protein